MSVLVVVGRMVVETLGMPVAVIAELVRLGS
jgi:hypothetical protein